MSRAEAKARVDAVVIGRNEGARLVASLTALEGRVRRIIYVDSGSSDGSQMAAEALGAELVALDMARPFTAARARNAGLAALEGNPPEFVQFIDGDCVLREGWIPRAVRFLDENLRAAVVCGRRREAHPEASVYNRLIDSEWNTPVGEAQACGGDALMRYLAVSAVDGFREDLIAGEEPELCLRLRARGWSVWRIDAEMTEHDARLTRFGQWWKRSERAGFAFAEGAARFSTTQQPHWRREVQRILFWGAVLPLIALLGLVLLPPWGLLVLLAWPAQVLRLQPRMGWAGAFFNTLGKLPESLGALRFGLRWIRGGEARLIEYR